MRFESSYERTLRREYAAKCDVVDEKYDALRECCETLEELYTNTIARYEEFTVLSNEYQAKLGAWRLKVEKDEED